jgi:bifunctional non-homologous end joining protein LigD/DNA ligase-1
MTPSRQLPEFIKPMLAKSGAPFDSDAHLFEIKWDGIRALAYVEGDGYRLMSRRGSELTSRYPELAALRRVTPGTILDGELVVLDERGLPSFRGILRREQSRSALRCQTLARSSPATYMLFDQLYERYSPVLDKPLTDRRKRMLRTVESAADERLVSSEGIVGPGQTFFAQAVERGMEGAVAKRLDSRYLPGRRSDAWIKFRKSSSLLCAIIGYVPKDGDFESLILAAADDDGQLRCVGRVGTGFDAELRQRLTSLLQEYESPAPLIPCPEKGTWLHPGLYCAVRFLERTAEGDLREPVFQRLIEG